MENMSLSDIAAVTRGNDDGDGWGGNGAWWIIVLFLFMFGAGWNRGGGANGEPVTEAGLCNAMNFNNLENAVGRLSVALSAIPTPPRLPLGTIRTSTLMRADAEPRSKLLPSIFGSLGRPGRKSSPPRVKGAHNGC